MSVYSVLIEVFDWIFGLYDGGREDIYLDKLMLIIILSAGYEDDMYRIFVIIMSLIMAHTSAASEQLDIEYKAEFTDMIEYVYGETMLSQGGEKSIDLMFENTDLNGKKALDIGSGFGGVDLYLATKYNVQITGIDRVKRLVEKAKYNIADKKLKGLIKFLHIDKDNTLADFEDNQFDIIFAKESILHIADKMSVFNDAYRVLKPGGEMVILDWLRGSEVLGPNIKKMMEVDELDLDFSSIEEYENALNKAGFRDIKISNKNKPYIEYTNENLERIGEKKDSFIKHFDQETFGTSIQSWSFQKKAFENNEIIVSLITAYKY